MSEYSNERKEKYIEEMLEPGERIWFFRLTGHTMVKSRTALFVALAKKVWEVAGKQKPWKMFRFGIERDLENKHDDSAVSVFMWRQVDGEWKKFELGYIPRSERGEGKIYHSKAVSPRTPGPYQLGRGQELRVCTLRRPYTLRGRQSSAGSKGDRERREALSWKRVGIPSP